MTDLLVFREQLKKFYSKYELYLTPVFKFFLALVTLVMINSSIGYMSELKKSAVVLVLALMCSFLPMNFIVVAAAAVTLGHLYKFSMECALIFAKGYNSSTADTIVFRIKDSLCNADCSGTRRNSVFGSFRGERGNCVLYNRIYD